MKCPSCGNNDHRVLSTSQADDRIMRTRECITCGKRIRTAEVPVDVLERAKGITEAYRSLGQVVGEE